MHLFSFSRHWTQYQALGTQRQTRQRFYSKVLSLVGMTDNTEIQYSVIYVVTVGVQEAMEAERMSSQEVRGGFTEEVTSELGLKDE